MRLLLRISSAFALVVSLSAAAPGCGGSSTTNDENTDGPDDSSSGGETTDAGAPGSGGSGNSGTGARSSGGSAGRGSAGRGGSSFGGDTSDGEAGAGATPSAGAGGASQGIPPELLDRCDTLCASVAEAQCSADEPATNCALGCRLAIQQPECVSSFEALFACTEDAEFVCNASGEATPEGCETQFTLATACLITNIADPELEQPCADYCERSEAANCASAPAGDCAFGCQAAGGALPACAPLWKQFLACSEDATFTCDSDGTAVPGGCEVQMLLYFACVLQEAQQ